MKKHLIAAAVAAAVAVPAAAQVTVYGILDKSLSQTSVENLNGTVGTTAKVDGVTHGVLAGERLGFRGEEDLGGGLKAHFVYELAIGTFSGNSAAASANADADGLAGGTTTARTQIVGLSGAFGRIDIGRDKTPSQLFAETFTAGGANNFVGEGILYKGIYQGASSSTTGSSSSLSASNHLSQIGLERQQGVTYSTPTINGFQARAMFVNNDSEGSRTSANAVAGRSDTSLTDVAVYYRGIKGLTVGVARGDIEVQNSAITITDVKDEATQFGLSYAYGPVTVFAQRFDAEGEDTNGAKDSTAEVDQFGVRFQANANLMVFAQMSSGEVGGTAKTHDTDSYQLGALYSLSKRTTAYALMGEQKNKVISTGVDIKSDGFAIGLRHSF
jgi:predicted porin